MTKTLVISYNTDHLKTYLNRKTIEWISIFFIIVWWPINLNLKCSPLILNCKRSRLFRNIHVRNKSKVKYIVEPVSEHASSVKNSDELAVSSVQSPLRHTGWSDKDKMSVTRVHDKWLVQISMNNYTNYKSLMCW